MVLYVLQVTLQHYPDFFGNINHNDRFIQVNRCPLWVAIFIRGNRGTVGLRDASYATMAQRQITHTTELYLVFLHILC